MDIIISCQLSLSKKLRAIIGNSKTNITLVSDTLKDGRGMANIMLCLDNLSNKDIEELINKETSLMFTPVEVKENVSAGSDSVSSIFSSNVPNVDKSKSGKRDVVSKLAVITPPEKGQEGYAMKTREEIDDESPAIFKDATSKGYKKFVENFEQLMTLAKKASSKEYEGDLDAIKSIKDPKQRERKLAVALEEQQKAEAIDFPVYIVNEKYASLAINDLGINLILNVPFNLANISAKRIIASKDLSSLARAEMIKIIQIEEVPDYMQRVKDAEMGSELEVFGDKHGSASRAAENGIVDKHGVKAEEIDMTDERDEDSEQEKLSKMVVNKPETNENSANSGKFKFSGSNQSNQSNLPRQSGVKKIRGDSTPPTTPNKAGIKPIRKTGIEFD